MTIKQLITKLNEIDIDDLKNIDMNKFKDNVLEKPHLIINILLILIALLVAFNTITHNIKTNKALKNDIQEYKTKLTALEELNKMQEEYDVFIKSFPSHLSSDQIYGTLSQIAIERNVQILNYTPIPTRKNDFLAIEGLIIKIQSEQYQDIVQFIYDIEEYPELIRITNWTGESSFSENSDSRRQSQQQEKKENPKILATIQVESVELNK